MARRIKTPNPYSNRRPVILQTGLGEDGAGTWEVTQNSPTLGETIVRHSTSGEYFILPASTATGGGLTEWTAATAVVAGDSAVTPTGALVISNSDRTTSGTYNAAEAANWTFVGSLQTQNAFAASTYYYAGQEVLWQGYALLKRNADGTSGAATVVELTNWSFISQNEIIDFPVSTITPAGVTISEQGLLYESLSNHTTAATFALDEANWTATTASILDWVTSTDYEVNDYINTDGRIYKVITAHTSDATSFDTTPALYDNYQYVGGQAVNRGASFGFYPYSINHLEPLTGTTTTGFLPDNAPDGTVIKFTDGNGLISSDVTVSYSVDAQIADTVNGSADPFVLTPGRKSWEFVYDKDNNDWKVSKDTMTVQTLTYAATTNWDTQLGDSALLTMTGDTTMSITNYVEGKVYYLSATASGADRTINLTTNNIDANGDDISANLIIGNSKTKVFQFIGDNSGRLQLINFRSEDGRGGQAFSSNAELVIDLFDNSHFSGKITADGVIATVPFTFAELNNHEDGSGRTISFIFEVDTGGGLDESGFVTFNSAYRNSKNSAALGTIEIPNGQTRVFEFIADPNGTEMVLVSENNVQNVTVNSADLITTLGTELPNSESVALFLYWTNGTSLTTRIHEGSTTSIADVAGVYTQLVTVNITNAHNDTLTYTVATDGAVLIPEGTQLISLSADKTVMDIVEISNSQYITRVESYYPETSNTSGSVVHGTNTEQLGGMIITDASAVGSYFQEATIKTATFENLDTYHVELLVKRATVANHVINLALEDNFGTNQSTATFDIGTGQTPVLVSNGDAGTLVTTWSATTYEHGDNDSVLIKADLAYSGTTTDVVLRIAPVFNLDGGLLVDDAAVGSLEVLEVSHGAAAEFAGGGLAQLGVLPLSISQQGIYTAEGTNVTSLLPAATGSQDRVMVLSQLAGVGSTISVQVGDAMNGAVDATYTTQSDGEVVLFIDNEAGKWTAQVIGAAQMTDLSYMMARPASSTSIDTLDSTNNLVINTTIQSSGTGITNNGDGSYTLTGGFRYKLKSNLAFTSDGGEITNTDFRWYDVTNSAFIGSNSYYTDFAGDSSPKPTDATAFIDILTDTIVAVRPTNNVDNNISFFQDTSHIVIEQIASASAVLAGMVVPSPLSFMTRRASSQAENTSVVDNASFSFDTEVNSNGSGITYDNTTNRFTLEANKSYRLSGTVAYNNAANIRFCFWDTTNDVQIGVASQLDASGAGIFVGSGQNVTTFTTTAITEVELRNLSGASITVGVDAADDLYPQVTVEQIATSTVVDPDSIVPETLHRVRMTKAADLTLAAVTDTLIAYDAADYNVGTIGDITTGEVTITQSGYYKIRTGWKGKTQSANNQQAQIWVDGVRIHRGGDEKSSGGGKLWATAETEVYLNIGQVVTGYAYAGQILTVLGRDSIVEDAPFIEVIQQPTYSITYDSVNLEASPLHQASAATTAASIALATTTIGAGYEVLDIDDAQFSINDDFSLFTIADNSLTIVNDGKYLLNYHVALNATSTQGAAIYVDGVLIGMSLKGAAGSDGSGVTMFADLTAGQKVEFGATGTGHANAQGASFSLVQQPLLEVVTPGDVPVDTLDRALIYATATQTLDFTNGDYNQGLIVQSTNPIEVSFDAVDVDNNGIADLGNNQLVVVRDGVYNIDAAVTMDDGTAPSQLVTQILLNGALLSDNEEDARGITTNAVTSKSEVKSVSLVAGDIIKVYAKRFNQSAALSTLIYNKYNVILSLQQQPSYNVITATDATVTDASHAFIKAASQVGAVVNDYITWNNTELFTTGNIVVASDEITVPAGTYQFTADINSGNFSTPASDFMVVEFTNVSGIGYNESGSPTIVPVETSTFSNTTTPNILRMMRTFTTSTVVKARIISLPGTVDIFGDTNLTITQLGTKIAD